MGCSGEPSPDPLEPIGCPFGAVPAPRFRWACASVGLLGGQPRDGLAGCLGVRIGSRALARPRLFRKAASCRSCTLAGPTCAGSC